MIRRLLKRFSLKRTQESVLPDLISYNALNPATLEIMELSALIGE